MSRLTAIICAVVICLLVSMAWAINHYRDNAIEYKRQRDEKTQALALANGIIDDMQVRQQAIAELDVRYTQELADAKNIIERLRNDVTAGKRRLQLNAKCPPVRESSTSSGVDDAGAAELTPDAQRDYYRHRDGIATADKMIRGLQEYIRTQCYRR